MIRVSILAAILLLAGCATDPVVHYKEAPRPSVPQSALTCPDYPAEPTDDDDWQSAVAEWARRMVETFIECRTKLHAARNILNSEATPAPADKE